MPRNQMDSPYPEPLAAKSAPGHFSLLTCLFSLAGLLLLLYASIYRPAVFPPGHARVYWWEIGFFSGGCLLIAGLLFCSLSLWRQEAETIFKTFGLFLNFVAMFLICGAVYHSVAG